MSGQLQSDTTRIAGCPHNEELRIPLELSTCRWRWLVKHLFDVNAGATLARMNLKS